MTTLESTFANSRGVKLHTSSWLPEGDVKAIILLCHGYAVDSSSYFNYTASKLAETGYAVFGLDYEGHGKSEGLKAYIKDMNNIVDDLLAYFDGIRGKEEYSTKPKFLVGESMGGAIALLIHRKEPAAWNGAVLLAPMCKIGEEVQPPPVVKAVLTKLAYVFPTWPIVPGKDVISAANRDPVKREKIRSSPTTYKSKPRLLTAVNLLNVSEDLARRLDEVTLPFLLLHGEADTVTSPAISKELYDKAKSTDKTFNLYPGLWHSLTEGELDENVEIVFKDIISWLDAHSQQ